MKKDEKAKSLSYFCTEPNVGINAETIEWMKKESLSNKSCDIRISLHQSPEEKFHQMIIMMHKGNLYKPHKHLHKEESYNMIEGKMAVFIFDDEGKVRENQVLSPNDMFAFRIGKNQWHTQIPLTPFVIYNESKPGPFLKEGDSIYPKWNHYDMKEFIEKLLKEHVN